MSYPSSGIRIYRKILVIFLAIVTLIGTTDDTVDLPSSTHVIVVFGFTLIWIIRSAAIKYFSK